jgi:hypothetical protein
LRRFAAHPVHFAFLEDAKQFGLEGQIHFAYFIQQDGASVGQFEFTDFSGDGSGETPFSWPNSSLSAVLPAGWRS